MKFDVQQVDRVALQQVNGGAGGKTTVAWALANPAFQALIKRNEGKPVIDW